MKDKSCGNCKHMENQDLDGVGWCEKTKTETHCELSCDFYESLNGWTEITPDNVDMIYDGCIVIVTDGTYYNKASDWYLSIGTMAKVGGYYYYVLPELKIE